MPKRTDIDSILIIGAGPIVIGQACEFDYSGAQACKALVRRALSRFRVPYITVTPTFSICPKHGYLSGRHEFCPRCDAELLARTPAAASAPQTQPEEELS